MQGVEDFGRENEEPHAGWRGSRVCISPSGKTNGADVHAEDTRTCVGRVRRLQCEVSSTIYATTSMLTVDGDMYKHPFDIPRLH
jgi:hypothetical protein